jgi:16S rRNA A1518/A1519 N6-dimethyltransferase RsmA/KsgA/DIM1 with predicted DNA glycosylase/AP lyase activity
MGAPYVATQDEEIKDILEKAHLKKADIFIELGCGDGRVTREAVSSYNVKGIGYDINPLLTMAANSISKILKLQNIQFRCENVLKADLSEADVIYIYLFPALVKKLKTKLEKETKRPVMIISHGFTIPFLADFQISSRQGKRFKSYYYRLSEKG